MRVEVLAMTTGHSFSELAELVPGARLHGDPEARVSRLVHPTQAEGSSDLVLLLARPYLEMGAAIEGEKPGIVVGEDLFEEAPELVEQFPAALVLERPRLALAYLTPLFPRTAPRAAAIDPSAHVAETAQIGKDCHIGPLCFVGENAVLGDGCHLAAQATVEEGAVLGENCRLQPGARVADGVRIGNRVILNQNCVVGSDGFSFVTPEANAAEEAKAGRQHTTEGKEQGILRIDSLGTVILEDDVEVGACTTIDRATLGATIVKKGTKLDNLVQIGHNNTIGEHGLLCAHVGIAGSCVIGDRVVMAGQSGMADGIKIGDDVVVMGRGAVIRDLASGGVYGGFPAKPAKEELRIHANLRKLSEMRKEMSQLKSRLEALED